MSSEFLCQDLEAKLFNWFAGRLDASIIKRSSEMTNQQIKELYDTHPNMTLRELSRITGLSISELKFILTCTEEEY